mmetsp:Transcript_17811/g.30189  ORF Transcript_17811/g.30189 Transcript_17811/m.30189 type:complete len:84 (-) Transcript_17811:94-345(-)
MEWCLALPYSAPSEVVANIEEVGQASAIPKLTVFSLDKGFEKCVVMDIKHIISKNENVAEAVTQVMAKIQHGEENFDHQPEEQ